MASDNYESNSLISKYIDVCHQAEQPLTGEQIGLLEKTINEAFGIKKNKSPPIDLVKPLDEGLLNNVAMNIRVNGSSSTRVMNVLKGWRKNRDNVSNELPITEAEAWSLYSLTLEEVWTNPETIEYPEFKQKYGIPKMYGGSTFHILRRYFQERGILDEETPFPNVRTDSK